MVRGAEGCRGTELGCRGTMVRVVGVWGTMGRGAGVLWLREWKMGKQGGQHTVVRGTGVCRVPWLGVQGLHGLGCSSCIIGVQE